MYATLPAKVVRHDVAEKRAEVSAVKLLSQYEIDGWEAEHGQLLTQPVNNSCRHTVKFRAEGQPNQTPET